MYAADGPVRFSTRSHQTSRVVSQRSHSELSGRDGGGCDPRCRRRFKIGRNLATDDVKPHRVQELADSARQTQPGFGNGLRMCAVAPRAPPASTVVLSIDERPGSGQVPANATQGVKPGGDAGGQRVQPSPRDGVVGRDVDVATGKSLLSMSKANDSAHFIGFLTRTARNRSTRRSRFTSCWTTTGPDPKQPNGWPIIPVSWCITPVHASGSTRSSLLLDPHPQVLPARLHSTRRSRRQNARLHRTPQQHRPTFKWVYNAHTRHSPTRSTNFCAAA